jgi:hypothetical protein
VAAGQDLPSPEREAKEKIVSELSYQTGARASWEKELQKLIEKRKEESDRLEDIISYTPTAAEIQDLWVGLPIIFTGKAEDIEPTNPGRTEYRLKVAESTVGGEPFDGGDFALSLTCPEELVMPVWTKAQDEFVSIGDNIAVAARISRVEKKIEDDVPVFTGYGTCVSLEYIPED